MVKRNQQAPIYTDLSDDVQISFEFFPPKTDAMEASLWSAVKALEPLQPRFVSVTYGAGGSTRDRTHATVQKIVNETSLTPAAHLTCVAATKADVDDVAREYWQSGVRHIVALRGDMPDMTAKFQPHPGGYENAADLVKGLAKVANFEISVAAYPEAHPDSASRIADVENLKRKIDAGATRAITQCFFDTDMYFRYVDLVLATGCKVEIVPGILPVTSFAGLRKFAGNCGATIPSWMADLFDGLDDHPTTRQLVAATVAAEFCRKLHDGGVREFHFYTLNRAELSHAICHLLGVREKKLELAA
jgi:methylenetetrahydrofolate reductase (NADPH)